MGLILVGIKRIWPLAQLVRDGGWRESPWWPARELHGRYVGIIGAGNIGRHVIRLLAPFEPRILVYDPFLQDDEAARLGVEKAELDDLLSRADVVTLHTPSLPDTEHLIDGRRLALMKDDALIVNTARGSLFDEKALVAELSRGRFFAFLDVTDPEPPGRGQPAAPPAQRGRDASPGRLYRELHAHGRAGRGGAAPFLCRRAAALSSDARAAGAHGVRAELREGPFPRCLG